MEDRSNEESFQCSWPPSTPFQDIMRSIHEEMHEKQQNESEWLRLGRITPGLGKEAQVGGDMSSFRTPVTWGGLNDLEMVSPGNGKNVIGSDTEGIGIDHEFEALESITFSDLLGLRDGATETPASSNSMLFSGHYFQLGSALQLNGNCTTENNGLAVPRQHSYDLNFPPDMGGNDPDISRFEPMTPEKAGRAENRQVTEMQNLHVSEGNNQERNENEGAASRIDDNRMEGPSQPVADSSSLVVSPPSKDNHNPEEGSSKRMDLNKTPQLKPRRRKHRPKVVTEGKKPKQGPKPVTSKSGGSKESLPVKRKYVRRKGVDKSTAPSADADQAHPATLLPTRNSCRRALNFNAQEQQHGSSTQKSISNLDSESRELDCCNGVIQSKPSVQVSQQTESIVENKHSGFAYDPTCSENEVIKDYIPLSEGKVPSTLFKMNTNTSEEILGMGKDLVIVHDKQEDSASYVLKNKNQSAMRCANDTICSTKTGATEVVYTRRSKRKYSHVIEQASDTNRTGAHYNSLQAYELCLHIPNSCKKKRSEKGQKLSYSTEMINEIQPSKKCSNSHANAYAFAAKANYRISTPSQLPTTQVPAILSKSGRQGLDAKQCTEMYLMALTEKTSRTTAWVCDMTSLNRSAVCQVQKASSARQGTFDNTHGIKSPQKLLMCMEEVVDMQHKVAKKKRSKKRNSFPSINQRQLHQQIVLHKHRQLSTKSPGSDAKIRWQGYIDVITEQLKYLDINRESDKVLYQGTSTLVPYSSSHNALICYRSDGTVVPFQGPIKTSRPRPKVDLDEETNRVFKLLLENINNEGIDGTDEEKRKWWEEERRVFRGRADSFVARMHLVQGDRRFSLWKGSVVDSVVGVFLTQNVTDHLSSSAFMSLAAHYPLKSKSNHKPLHEEEVTLLVKKAEVCILDPDSEQTIEWKNMSNGVSDQSSMTFHDNEHIEEKEVVDSNVSPGIKTVDVSLIEKLSCSSLNSSENCEETYHGLTTKITRTEICTFEQCDIAINGAVSSQNYVNSPQNNVECPIAQTAERIGPYSNANSEAETLQNGLQSNKLNDPTSLMDLQRMVGSTALHVVSSRKSENAECEENSKDAHSSSGQSILTAESTSHGTVEENVAVIIRESSTPYSENIQSSNLQGDENMIQSQNWYAGDTNAETLARGENDKVQQTLNSPNLVGETLDITESTVSDKQRINEGRTAESKALKEMNAAKQKSRRVGREINNEFEWDTLRRDVEANGKKKRLPNTMDSLDWDAVRCADVNKISETIKERGMNNVLAARIKAFLDRVVNDHGSIDLEWLRDIEPDKAKEYLLSIRGLGLKSVECVRLLTLQHLAFPVDTNVGRIAVRLGWVPLQPLPESLQLHLLELYPVMESIQRYLWPRLCKLKQKELYELHYQMITFGKVFCTKSKPNCNACPMRGDCRHFASAFASARLSLPAPEEKSIVSAPEKTLEPDIDVHMNALSLPAPEEKSIVSAPEKTLEPDIDVHMNALSLPAPEEKSIVSAPEKTLEPDIDMHMNALPLLPPHATQQLEGNPELEASLRMVENRVSGSCEPIIEEPASPEPEITQYQEYDLEDSLCEDIDDIPTIKLNIEEFTQNLQHYMQDNMELQEGEMSKALVALTPEAASIPMPKLKNVSRLRTEHQVYELPDSHPLLEGMDKREPDDPCSYLLAIWTPGETANSIHPPEGGCSYQESGKLCDQKTCSVCNSIREANSQMVRGTLLIPCRTATRGSFPLNGTYFQVNEVFADHASSLNPINIPRKWLWNLPRKTVFFGTSVSSIFKGLSTEDIQYCFWRGHVCVRGFDHKTRVPRPLMARLHLSASRLTKEKGNTVDR